MPEAIPRGSVPLRSGFRVPGGELAEPLRRLAQVTAELAAAESIEAVAQAVVWHAADVLGAAMTTLMLRQDEQLVLAGAQGLQPGVAEEWASFSLAEQTPAGDAARSGRPVTTTGPDDLHRRYPRLRGQRAVDRSTLCLPLGAPPANVGVVAMAFDGQWLPGSAEMAFLTPFADACAQAVRRLDATREAALRQRQLRFLADVSWELGRSLDYRTTLRRVASLVVPDLADWCAVHILEDGRLATLAVAHVDPAKVAWAWELQDRFPPPQDAPTGVPAVVRTGISELHSEITDDLLVAGARDAEELALLRDLRMRSALVVPLSARNRVLGAITLIRTGDTAAHYGRQDLSVAEDLGRRAGVAIDNAHRHSETRDVALQLQHAMLPDLPPALPGWQLATLYEPAGTAQVGGDFFDALPLPDGRLAVVVGDVMGHGIRAAASMAHVRAAVRGFVTINPNPSWLMDRLQIMFAQLRTRSLVSLIYAIADRASNTVEIVSAGAMPPLLIPPDGSPEYLPVPIHPILGAGTQPTTTLRCQLPAAAALLLYTDGLVERRGEVIDVGLDRLSARARELLTGRLDIALPALAAELRQFTDSHDDVTALALRSTP